MELEITLAIHGILLSLMCLCSISNTAHKEESKIKELTPYDNLRWVSVENKDGKLEFFCYMVPENPPKPQFNDYIETQNMSDGKQE